MGIFDASSFKEHPEMVLKHLNKVGKQPLRVNEKAVSKRLRPLAIGSFHRFDHLVLLAKHKEVRRQTRTDRVDQARHRNPS